jgi:hypothetical protein
VTNVSFPILWYFTLRCPLFHCSVHNDPSNSFATFVVLSPSELIAEAVVVLPAFAVFELDC